jgi:hypothetical protein
VPFERSFDARIGLVYERVEPDEVVGRLLSEGVAASGMSNDTSVLADVTAGEVTALARRRAAAPDVWTWEVEITDAGGRTCSFSKVLIAVRPMRPPR